MGQLKNDLIENCMLCNGELHPASEGRLAHIYADYFYDPTGASPVEDGVLICPNCKFVLCDTRFWDGPTYSVSFAYDDVLLDGMHTMIPERDFETNCQTSPPYRKLLNNLSKIRERIQDINGEKIYEPLEKGE